MGLSNELVSQFAKVIQKEKNTKQESTVYGTAVEYNGKTYVKIDGSDLLTPASTTVAVKNDNRVTVMIKNHTATITGNISSPSLNMAELDDTNKNIANLEALIANKVSANEFEAEKGRIDDLEADNVTIHDSLAASEADISSLEADNVNIKKTLTAVSADIKTLETEKLDADTADIKYATVEDLNATNGNITNLSGTFSEFQVSITNKLSANEADIKDLQADKLDTTSAEIMYANVDFTNINQAAVKKIFTDSGIIKDLVVSEGKITGKLVGVTIVGDLIEGNTIKADKLVIKGSDGIYYKLNIEGGATTSEQVSEEDLKNGLSGSIIIAKSVTAEKIAVDDLVAFDATIGGFNITDSSIYSGVKSSVDNTTRGIYFDKEAQFSVGDSNNFFKYHKDQNGNYKLEISASSLVFSSSNTSLEDVVNRVDNLTIGGSNLIRGTNDVTNLTSTGLWSNGTWGSASSGTGTRESIEVTDSPNSSVKVGWHIASTNGQVMIAQDNVPTTNEQEYTMSCYAKGTGKVELQYGNGTVGYQYKDIVLNSNSVWERYSFTFKSKGEGDAYFGVSSANYDVHICGMKLEKGNIATDWSPAPEDIESNVSNNYTTKTEFDSLEIGGRNLAIGTGTLTGDIRNLDQFTLIDETFRGNSVGRSNTAWLDATTINLTAIIKRHNLKAGDILTFSAWNKTNNPSARIYCCYYFPTSTTVSKATELKKLGSLTEANVWRKLVCTFTINENMIALAEDDTEIHVRFECTTDEPDGYYQYWSSPKIEPGSKATDWTPAPEEVQNGIDDAAKTATNFLGYDSSGGLQIGNKIGGSWSGFRTQITGAAFNILNSAGSVLASYGEKLIELGKNATDAVIKLCGGKGRIEYITDEDSNAFLQVYADKLRLMSSQMSSLYSMYTDESTKWEKSAVNVSTKKVNMYASECIDPTMVEKVEGWNISELTINPGSIEAITPGNVTVDPDGVTKIKSNVYISSVEKTAYNDGVDGWYFGTDGSAHATNSSKGGLIGFHYAGSQDYTSLIRETSSGVITINGMDYGVNQVLWSGAYYMNDSQTITLSKAISKQTSGIILVFSYYDSGAAKDHSFNTHFVSKKQVELFPNCGHTFMMGLNAGFSSIGAKYLYFTDTTISGHSGNTTSGTNSGITFNNSKYVLRYVIGV